MVRAWRNHFALAAYVVLALMAFGTPGAAKAGVGEFTVAVNHAPPYRIIDQESGTYRGFYIDIAVEMARRQGLTVKFLEVPFKRALVLMQTGAVDMLLGPNRTAEREQYMAYFTGELPAEDKAFFLRADAPDIQSYEDLQGRSVAVLRGATYFDRFDNDTSVMKFQASNYEQALTLVSRGRVDATIVPEQLGDYLLLRTGFELKKATLKAGGRPSFFSVSRKSPLMEIKPALEETWRAMQADGTIEAMIARYR